MSRKNTGFRPAGMLAEDTLEPPEAETERICFVAQKTGSGHDRSE
ncbi:MAG: hypothetical protein ACOY4Q_11500 [Bacillota bacterium]